MYLKADLDNKLRKNKLEGLSIKLNNIKLKTISRNCLKISFDNY